MSFLPPQSLARFVRIPVFALAALLPLAPAIADDAAESADAPPPTAREWFASGAQAFAASNYADSATAFASAAESAPAEKLDPAVAQFNAGLAATAAGDLEAAAKHFADATSAADLGVQAKAYYNRGNALFQLASAPLDAAASMMPAPALALDASEKSIGEAIQSYENAIALDPADVDAKANYELALQKQQEIQQQQQQQQNQDQQNQDQQDQDPNSENQPQDQPESSPESNQNEESQPQQPPPQEQEQDQEQPQDQQEPQNPQAQQDQPSSAQPNEPSDEMTPEEAEMLLNALREQEQSQRDRLQPFFGRPVPVEKDW
jgi:Ca-activated chloride channel homolog